MEQDINNNQQTEIIKRKSNVQISTPAAIVTAGVLIAIAIIFGKGSNTQEKNKNIKTVPEVEQTTKNISINKNDPIRGDIQNADIVIVEYSDSDCIFCERFHGTMKSLLELSSVKVAWVYRYFPITSLHPNAKNEALALVCVKELGGNDTFWKYLDEIISITVSPDKSYAMLEKMAKDQGIDKDLFSKCVASESSSKVIEDQVLEAQSLGAQGTPFSVVINTKNGKQVAVPGAYPIEEMKKIIDNLLK